ncbi:MAG TPA: cytochrome c biogenesis protein CcdA [Firmicutes bacterium]|nr:cytochrome c biogenesis protein CcdA [Bacillota bacterium]
MTYLITFLEGLVTFISPCLLPMLPIYVSYFAGNGEAGSQARTLKNALGFVCGFTLVFLLLGVFAGSIGSLLRDYQTAVNIVSGLIVIFFGLHFMGVFKFQLFKGSRPYQTEKMGFFSSLLFGIVFSVGWTPCVGAFLGSALMLASQQGTMLEGMLLLLCYSAGLGIPFLISAVLIDSLKRAFGWIKSHYKIINTVSGCFLVLVGILMATGMLNRLLSLMV